MMGLQHGSRPNKPTPPQLNLRPLYDESMKQVSFCLLNKNGKKIKTNGEFTW
jgi:hypothetical protein